MEPNYVTGNLWKNPGAGGMRTCTWQKWGFKAGLKGFWYDFHNGHKFGYPKCCVLEFSLRWLIGFPKLINHKRFFDRRKTPGYMPCFFHRLRLARSA